jgi:hypothetical protein
MFGKRVLALISVASALSACGGSPGKGDVQEALERLAKDEPMMFGSDKLVVKDAKCTEKGKDTYECITLLAASSDPDAHPVTVRMTKLDGKWTAQVANVLQ